MDLTSAVTAYRSFKISSHFPTKYSHLIPQILSYSTEITPDSLHEVFHDLNNSQTWENVAFSLLLAIHILNSSNYLDYQSELIITLNDNMMNYLEHEESRVRQLACRLIGILVQRNGYKEYNILYESVISCVRRNSERECHTRPVILGEEKELALDEVTGWRALETSYNAFKELVKSLRHYVLTCESSDEPFLQTWRRSRVAPIGAEALQIFILDAGVHINRYVRQSCCELVDIMCQLPSTRSPYHRDQVIGDGMPRERSSIFTEYPSPSVVIALRNVLAIGLQDSWCQVRLAATFATNSLLSTISGESNLENLIWPLILPRICLNRHYSTDSVKEVAQDTWIKRLGTRGRELLSTYMSDVVPYYVSMTRHKNHIVCEAACASIAELVSRIPSPAVNQYLPLLIVALRDSLIDASWPVRDRACIAIGRYIRSIWNRDIDVNSPIQVKSISIPTIQDILEYDQGQRLSEELVESSQEEKLSILTIMQEAIDILLNYLRTDPFHPVRESAAISLIDCILPPVTVLGVPESLLKSQFQEGIWSKIENYIVCHLPKAAQDSIDSQLAATPSTSKPVNKNIRFLPDSIVSELMSGSAVSVRNTNETVDPKPLIPPSESEGTKKVEIQPWGGTTKGKIKRSKPRLGGGWGCCLDCAAGENRELYPWEVSETAIFLLRELIGTLPQNQDFESRLRFFLHSQLKNIWLLLHESNQRDIHKLHTAIYQILPYLMEGLDRQVYEREIHDHLTIFIRDLNPPEDIPAHSSGTTKTFSQDTTISQNEERNRIQAMKELQKKAISSQAYCYSSVKKCATLDCCEKLESVLGIGYFQRMKTSEPGQV